MNLFLIKMQNLLKKFKLTRLDFAMAFGLILAISLTSFFSFAKSCELKENEVLRLHILANSNTNTDQELKYSLRDRLLNEFSADMSMAQNVEQAKNIAKNNLQKYEEISQNFIIEKGFSYDVKAEVVNMYFTTRNYQKYTLPAGNYDAVRIIIGSGEGKNWWCLMYPSLCLPAVSTDLDTEEPDSQEVILTQENSIKIEESKDIEFKFAIYEFIKGWFN